MGGIFSSSKTKNEPVEHVSASTAHHITPRSGSVSISHQRRQHYENVEDPKVKIVKDNGEAKLREKEQLEAEEEQREFERIRKERNQLESERMKIDQEKRKNELKMQYEEQERQSAQAQRASERRMRAAERERRERENNSKLREEMSTGIHHFEEISRQSEERVNQYRNKKIAVIEEIERQQAHERNDIERERLEERKKHLERELVNVAESRNDGLQTYREELKKMNEQHENQLKDITRKADDRIRYKNIMIDEERRKMGEENVEFDAEIREIEKEMEEQQAQSDRMWEDRKRKMEEQHDLFVKAVRMKIWNDAVEHNWNIRLNFLRSANREVERKCKSLCRLMEQNSSGTPVRTENFHKLTNMKLTDLKKALYSESTLMKTEAANLKNIYENFPKDFIRDIITSLELVVIACQKLNKSLSFEATSITTKETLLATKQQISFSNVQLVETVNRIPTLSELKSSFANMRRAANKQQYAIESSQEAEIVSTVIIEEIE